MEQEQQNIDLFFKEKLEQLPVSFNETHWNIASKRLDEKDKKRKAFWLPLFLLVSIFTLATGLVITKTNQNKLQAASYTIQSKEQTTLNATNSNNNQVIQEKIESNTQQTNTSIAKVNSVSIAITPKKQFECGTSELLRKQPINSNTISKLVEVDIKNIPKIENATITSANVKDNAMAIDNTERPLVTTIKKDEPSFSKPKRNIHVETNNPRYITTLKDYTETEKDPIVVPEKNKEITIAQPSMAVKIDTQQQADSMPATRKFFTTATIQTGTTKTLQANNHNPIQANTVMDTKTFHNTLYGGIGYTYLLQKKWSIQGLLALTFYKGINTEIRVSKIKYRYGRINEDFILHPSTQYQVQLPIQLKYRITPKHQFAAGFGLSFGLGLSGEVKEFEKATFKKTFGYNAGYLNEDVFLQANYYYQIKPNIALTCMYQQGLRDMSKNDFFANSLLDKLIRIQAGISYNMPSKNKK